MNGENDIAIKINPLMMAFIVFQMIFVIILIVSLPNLFQDNKISAGDYNAQPKVSIEGLQEILPTSSADKVGVIERSLLEIIKNNVNEVNLGESVATVRDVNGQYFSYENVYFLSFIVDIPALKQSYQMFYQDSSDEYSEYIGPDDTIIPLCLGEYEEKIYSEFNCKDIYDQTTRNVIVSKYLSFFGFENFSAFIDLTEPYDVRINPIAGDISGGDSRLYINMIKEKISSLGISPEMFRYSVVQPEEIDYML